MADPNEGMAYYGATGLGNPRRPYGSFAHDGSPMPPSVMAPGMYTDDLMGYGMDDGDGGDPKRRRIARV